MKSTVYLLKWGDKKRIDLLFDKLIPSLRLKKGDAVAIKMHFGEEGNKGYISPDFIKPLVKKLKDLKILPFLTDTNTIYRGKRDNAIEHLMLAFGHGFSQHKVDAPVIIADGIYGEDHIIVEIEGEKLKKVKIAKAIASVKKMIVLSHFKGHLLAGFGGAIKNLGMGCAAKVGKYEMHSGLHPDLDTKPCISCGNCITHCPVDALKFSGEVIALDEQKCVGCGDCVAYCPTGALSIRWTSSSEAVQEKTVEYALGAVKNKDVIYINFLNHITANCDCMAKDEKCIAPDIGILASSVPVAIDMASYDLVNDNVGKDVFKAAHPSVDALCQIEHAVKIGLGKKGYEIKNLA